MPQAPEHESCSVQDQAIQYGWFYGWNQQKATWILTHTEPHPSLASDFGRYCVPRCFVHQGTGIDYSKPGGTDSDDWSVAPQDGTTANLVETLALYYDPLFTGRTVGQYMVQPPSQHPEYGLDLPEVRAISRLIPQASGNPIPLTYLQMIMLNLIGGQLFTSFTREAVLATLDAERNFRAAYSVSLPVSLLDRLTAVANDRAYFSNFRPFLVSVGIIDRYGSLAGGLDENSIPRPRPIDTAQGFYTTRSEPAYQREAEEVEQAVHHLSTHPFDPSSFGALPGLPHIQIDDSSALLAVYEDLRNAYRVYVTLHPQGNPDQFAFAHFLAEIDPYWDKVRYPGLLQSFQINTRRR